MNYFGLFVIFFLAAVPFTDLATPVAPWDEMEIMHTWHDVPVNWETLGHPSAGYTIDLNIVLQPDQESALTDAVIEISNPKHSRHVLLTITQPEPLFICAATLFQISKIPLEGTG